MRSSPARTTSSARRASDRRQERRSRARASAIRARPATAGDCDAAGPARGRARAVRSMRRSPTVRRVTTATRRAATALLRDLPGRVRLRGPLRELDAGPIAPGPRKIHDQCARGAVHRFFVASLGTERSGRSSGRSPYAADPRTFSSAMSLVERSSQLQREPGFVVAFVPFATSRMIKSKHPAEMETSLERSDDSESIRK
mgnify:CR=1 FL=1